MKLTDIVNNAPDNKEILESFVITKDKLRQYDNILCSISGGSDSDILLDLCQKFDEAEKITYVFFDTGVEFSATKEHLKKLEEKYGITIEQAKAIKPIPTCCKEYGQPFLSKQVSEWIQRLQQHGFKWEDKPLEQLNEEYPNCRAALRWWCNDYPKCTNGRESMFNVGYNKYLKEFLIENPPQFKISNKCCTFAKKKVAEQFKKERNFDLSMYGVRKSEGGARASAYKNCFTSTDKDCDEYRPIFWYKEGTKREYEDYYGIEHSKCYTQYGLKRTGCAGCPFGRDFDDELKVMKEFEPNLYKAMNNIFGDSYEYTRMYGDFVKKQKQAKIESDFNENK